MVVLRYERPRPFESFDRFFDRWPTLWWTKEFDDVLHVDQFRENGTLVIRADIAGIDPDKDVDITMSDGVLHIHAQRREEEKTETKDYYRQEMRYGSFSRDVVLPEGCTEEDVTATYKDGILEVRVPVPTTRQIAEPRKVAISKFN